MSDLSMAQARKTARTLHAWEETYRLDQRQAEASRKRRNEAVRQALVEGWTHAQIAEATGLTRARIGQIALGVKLPRS